jgi:hypothetical protein
LALIKATRHVLAEKGVPFGPRVVVIASGVVTSTSIAEDFLTCVIVANNPGLLRLVRLGFSAARGTSKVPLTPDVSSLVTTLGCWVIRLRLSDRLRGLLVDRLLLVGSLRVLLLDRHHRLADLDLLLLINWLRRASMSLVHLYVYLTRVGLSSVFRGLFFCPVRVGW